MFFLFFIKFNFHRFLFLGKKGEVSSHFNWHWLKAWMILKKCYIIITWNCFYLIWWWSCWHRWHMRRPISSYIRSFSSETLFKLRNMNKTFKLWRIRLISKNDSWISFFVNKSLQKFGNLHLEPTHIYYICPRTIINIITCDLPNTFFEQHYRQISKWELINIAK